jgi:phosphohistidine phosphatase
MKTLFIIRHAKSSWANFGQSDFDRPLNDRGKTDAPAMALKLLKKNIAIDTFVSSTANRAASTCKAFADAYNIGHSQILFKTELYNAPEHVFYEVLLSLPAQASNVAIFAHNPGISEFANAMCEHVNIYDMPPCGVFAVSVDINNWADFNFATKQFLFFDKP